MTRALNIRGTQAEIFRTSVGKSFPLGTRMHLLGGRVFRYAKNGSTALTAGRVLQAVTPDVNLRDLLVDSSSRDSQGGPGGITTKKFTLNINRNTDITADAYEDGWLYLNDGTGEGRVYYVIGNERSTLTGGAAIGDATTLDVSIDGETDIALTSTTRATLLKNKYAEVVQSATPPTQQIVGVAPTAVTASYYFWMQTAGPCSVLQKDELLRYAPVAASRRTGGAVELATVVVPYGNALAGHREAGMSAGGFALVPRLGENSIDSEDRLAPISGLAVVPQLSIGHCIDFQDSGDHCLIHLTLED